MNDRRDILRRFIWSFFLILFVSGCSDSIEEVPGTQESEFQSLDSQTTELSFKELVSKTYREWSELDSYKKEEIKPDSEAYQVLSRFYTNSGGPSVYKENEVEEEVENLRNSIELLFDRLDNLKTSERNNLLSEIDFYVEELNSKINQTS